MPEAGEKLIKVTPEWLDKFREIMEPVFKEVHDRDDSWKVSPIEEITGHLTGYCPVQGEGMLDGHPWYFRARHSEWSFSIAENPQDDPIDVRWGKSPGWYYEGDYDNASWMAYKDAWDFIISSYEQYLEGEGYYKPTE